MFTTKGWTVPGHPLWRAKRVRRRGQVVAVRARHRVFRWRRITVQTRDLRHGAEAVARHLDGGIAGLGLIDQRGPARRPEHRAEWGSSEPLDA